MEKIKVPKDIVILLSSDAEYKECLTWFYKHCEDNVYGGFEYYPPLVHFRWDDDNNRWVLKQVVSNSLTVIHTWNNFCNVYKSFEKIVDCTKYKSYAEDYVIKKGTKVVLMHTENRNNHMSSNSHDLSSGSIGITQDTSSRPYVKFDGIEGIVTIKSFCLAPYIDNDKIPIGKGNIIQKGTKVILLPYDSSSDRLSTSAKKIPAGSIGITQDNSSIPSIIFEGYRISVVVCASLLAKCKDNSVLQSNGSPTAPPAEMLKSKENNKKVFPEDFSSGDIIYVISEGYPGSIYHDLDNKLAVFDCLNKSNNQHFNYRVYTTNDLSGSGELVHEIRHATEEEKIQYKKQYNGKPSLKKAAARFSKNTIFCNHNLGFEGTKKLYVTVKKDPIVSYDHDDSIIISSKCLSNDSSFTIWKNGKWAEIIILSPVVPNDEDFVPVESSIPKRTSRPKIEPIVIEIKKLKLRNI